MTDVSLLFKRFFVIKSKFSTTSHVLADEKNKFENEFITHTMKWMLDEGREEEMKSKIGYTVINVIAYVFLITLSFSTNGATAFTVPNAEPLITPAPYTFLIWLLIYGLWGFWMVWFGFRETQADHAYQKVSRFLPISLICSGLSLIVGQPLAGVFIVGALISASFSYLSSQHAKGEKIRFFRIPISVYLGWLSIATIVEIAILLKVNGFSQLFGLPETFWAIFVLMIGGFFAIVFTKSQMDFIYPLVFIWAYIGIAVKNLNQSTIFVTCCLAILLISWMMDQVKRMVSQS